MTGSVDINHVTLTYRSAGGGVLALRDTNLNVRRGEFAAVVGPLGLRQVVVDEDRDRVGAARFRRHRHFRR